MHGSTSRFNTEFSPDSHLGHGGGVNRDISDDALDDGENKESDGKECGEHFAVDCCGQGASGGGRRVVEEGNLETSCAWQAVLQVRSTNTSKHIYCCPEKETTIVYSSL